MIADDRKFMEMAVDQARQQLKRFGLDEGGERPNPKVGCVVVTKTGEIQVGYRGELQLGEHAEFTVMEKKMKNDRLAGATVYTTLEPCTDRKPPKKSCADRLIERQVSRVVIGLLDPDDRGQGYHKLLDANIEVSLFSPDLVREIRELNRRFIESRKFAKQKGGQPTPILTENTTPTQNAFAETASTFSFAFFNQRDEVLAQIGESHDHMDFTIARGPAFFLRIIPCAQLSRPHSSNDLMSKGTMLLHPFGLEFGAIVRTNAHGVISFNPTGHGTSMGSLSQAFRNGEIWGINVDILSQGQHKRPPLLLWRPIEATIYTSVHRYIAFLQSLGRSNSPHTIEVGILGVKNWTLAVSDPSCRGKCIRITSRIAVD